MLAFIVMASRSARKLRKNEMHGQTLVSLIVLSVGVTFGCSFRGVFLVANKDCDEIVDAIESNPLELAIDVLDCVLMTVFPLVALFYLFQRSAHGILDVRWKHDYAEICLHSDRSRFLCPVEVRNHTCHPHRDFEGLQAAWYYAYESLLEPATMSCISEYLPVLLVAHWLACGGGRHRTDHYSRGSSGIAYQLRRRLHLLRVMLKRSVVNCSHSVMKWKCWNSVLLSLAVFAMVFFVEEWFSALYHAMVPGPPAPDFVDDGKVAGYGPFTLAGQMVRHGVGILLCTTALLRLQLVPAEKLDSAHRAAARGDTTLLLGSLVAVSLRYLLEVANWQNLLAFGYATSFLSWWRTAMYLMALVVAWLQFFALRRIVALRDAELKTYESFLPYIALASFVTNFYNFIATFLVLQRTSTYLKIDEDYRFPTNTLLCEILGNLLVPGDFLYDFTAVGLWSDVLMRYLSMGRFDIGYPPQPRVTTC
ncbi:Protein F55G1.15 [Aphelenchoides avenae]|nr:Protein F55G1.15 [Aphelenchus avenae]